MQFRSPIVSNRKALAEMVHSGFNMIFGAFSNRSRRDYERMLQDPTSSSLIMAVILWITRKWPEAPLYLEDAKDNAVYDHPMLAKIKKPNPYYGGAALWFATLVSLVWNGNAYWIKIKNRDLSIKELWYVPHFQMKPMVNPGSTAFIDYYQYTPGGRPIQKLDPSDIVHFRYGIDPYNPREGMSPLKSIARDAVTDEEADNFTASMLINMGVPGLIIAPDLSAGQSVEVGDIDDAKKFFEEQFSGDRRGKPLVMRGPTKVTPFGFSPAAMDMSTIRGIPEERVSAVTGIPAAVVGFGSGLAQTKVGATMKEMREMAYDDGIIPLQRIIAPELETQLLDDFEPNPDEWEVKFDLSEVRVLQDDQDALYKRTIDAFNGGLIFLDEGRQELGFEGDEKAQHIRRIPLNVDEVGEGEQPPALAVPAAPVAPAKGRHAERKSISHAGAIFAKLQNRSCAKHQAAYTPELADAFASLGDRVVVAYEKCIALGAVKDRKDEGDLPPIDPSSPEGLAILAEVQKILAMATADGPLSDELAWQSHYLAVSTSTVENMKAVFGAFINMPDPVQRAILAKGGQHIALVGLDKQTQDAVFQALADGRTAGLGPREIARSIRSNIEGSTMYPGVAQEAHDRAIARGWSEDKALAAGDKAARQYRAEVISRTETKYAQNVSTIEVAKGTDTFNAILVTDGVYGPPRSGEIDIESNGQIVSFDDAQRVADDEHPNGTMSLTPVIADPDEIEEPLLGRGG